MHAKNLLMVGIVLVSWGCGAEPPVAEPGDVLVEGAEQQYPIPSDIWDAGDGASSGCAYGYGYGYGEDCWEVPVDCAVDPCLEGLCTSHPETGEDFCQCDEGWAGALCERCASGYYLHDSQCVSE